MGVNSRVRPATWSLCDQKQSTQPLCASIFPPEKKELIVCSTQGCCQDWMMHEDIYKVLRKVPSTQGALSKYSLLLPMKGG